MKTDDDVLKELELKVERLEHMTDTYRRATEDALFQLGWCVGYFEATQRPRVSRGLAVTMQQIREHLLDRPDSS